jgi:hypothetical protein
MLDCITKIWVIYITKPFVEARCGEWLGIFEDMSQDPIRVFCTTREFTPIVDGVLHEEMEVPSGVHICKVGVHSKLFQSMARGLLFFGTLERVRVCIKAKTNEKLFRLVFGAIKDLGFDLGLWN